MDEEEEEVDSGSTPAPADAKSVAAVERIEDLLAHAWMVRTFVKHAPEVEDFPELMQVVRTIFDASRAIETRRHDPVGYIRMVRKKLSKLRAAAAQFAKDAPIASDHTNFRMAVRSLDACVRGIEEALASCS